VGVDRAAVIGCLFLVGAWRAPAQENLIHAEIGGLRNNDGRVVCTLFSSADVSRKTHQGLRAHLRDFQPDTNLLGIPREGVGASNDAKGLLEGYRLLKQSRGTSHQPLVATARKADFTVHWAGLQALIRIPPVRIQCGKVRKWALSIRTPLARRGST